MSITRFLKKAKDIQEGHRQGDGDPPREAAGHDESNWLVSYADMMTLLCAFFIMMFSLSSLDKEKFVAVQKVLSQTVGGRYENPHKELHDAVSQVVDELGVEKNVLVSVDHFGLTVSFQGSLFFDSDSAYLSRQAKVALERLSSVILSQNPETAHRSRIIVEGHSDSQPLTSGAYASNWELASARAAQVAHELADQGFLKDQMSLVSYGDTRPVVPSRTPAGAWDPKALEANRRVIIRFLNPAAEIFPWDAWAL